MEFRQSIQERAAIAVVISKKEAYVVSKSVSFAAYDFCDSQVFEWNGRDDDAFGFLKNIQLQLTQVGYLHLNGIIKEKQKFRIKKFYVEN